MSRTFTATVKERTSGDPCYVVVEDWPAGKPLVINAETIEDARAIAACLNDRATSFQFLEIKRGRPPAKQSRSQMHAAKEQRQAEAYRQHENGVKNADIARELGVSPQAVSRYIFNERRRRMAADHRAKWDSFE